MNGRYGLEIRAATAADAPGLADLLEPTLGPIASRTLAERLEALRRQPGVILIANEWGPPSGIIEVSWVRTVTADQPKARIESFLVGKDHRRRGIGRLLLKSAAQAARSAGCDVLEIGLDVEAEGLSQFCAAAGFAPLGSTMTRPLRKRG